MQIGLGDYHPVSDIERLVCALGFLTGVISFSYITGELLFIIEKLCNIDNDSNKEEELDRFFGVFKVFGNSEVRVHSLIILIVVSIF